MKKQQLSALLFAIIFAVMPMILAANPTNTPSPAVNDEIAALRKEFRYPQWAIQRQIEGSFDMTVYVGDNGEVTMVNFDAERITGEITPLMAEISQKLYAHRFSAELAGQTVRIPFRFILAK